MFKARVDDKTIVAVTGPRLNEPTIIQIIHQNNKMNPNRDTQFTYECIIH